jgi:hypothetical protein
MASKKDKKARDASALECAMGFACTRVTRSTADREPIEKVVRKAEDLHLAIQRFLEYAEDNHGIQLWIEGINDQQKR